MLPASLYEHLWPLLRLADAELAHHVGLWVLRHAPLPLGRRVLDPFTWRGLHFANRVGVAAGFDKDAAALNGIHGLGAGFVEVGTVLNRPWRGNERPRLLRMPEAGGLWNRLGFPSAGLRSVRARLAAGKPPGLTIGCNIAPHPRTLREARGAARLQRLLHQELEELADGLYEHADFFVVNLSSPNTQGLRGVLQAGAFTVELAARLRQRLHRRSNNGSNNGSSNNGNSVGNTRQAPPLLVKIPPEQADGAAWDEHAFAELVRALAAPGVCDGFVAVNTSTRLSHAHAGRLRVVRSDAPGGVSGAPLFEQALAAQRMLAELAPEHLRIGVGGVMRAQDAVALVQAGAHLVELYTGLVYRGPGVIAECANALRGISAAEARRSG